MLVSVEVTVPQIGSSSLFSHNSIHDKSILVITYSPLSNSLSYEHSNAIMLFGFIIILIIVEKEREKGEFIPFH